MLQFLSHGSKTITTVDLERQIDPDALWYDLNLPTPEEITALNTAIGVSIPSIDQMSEIEESSRLYDERGILYMTAYLIASAEEQSLSVPVGFILSPKAVITVHYDELKSFQSFSKKIAKAEFSTPQQILTGLLDTVVERLADVLEKNASEIERLSHEIFQGKNVTDSKEMRDVLINIGQIGNLNSKARESLTSLDRLSTFLNDQLKEDTDKKMLVRIQKDIRSLTNYLSFLFSKIEFLLEASLGFINIEQNRIIKFFSIAAVIFLPPMVIASIYGMNFKSIPELHWVFGYPFALILMVLSAILPYLWFKRKGWI